MSQRIDNLRYILNTNREVLDYINNELELSAKVMCWILYIFFWIPIYLILVIISLVGFIFFTVRDIVKWFLNSKIGKLIGLKIDEEIRQRQQNLIQNNVSGLEWENLARNVVAPVLKVKAIDYLCDDIWWSQNGYYLFLIPKEIEDIEDWNLLKRKLERRYARFLGIPMKQIIDMKMVSIFDGYIWIGATTRASGSCGGCGGNPNIFT